MHLDKEEILKLISNEPDNAEHYQELGKWYIRQKSYDEAEKTLHRSLELDCDDAWTYMYLGNLHNHQGRFKEALGFFLHATQFIPNVSAPFWCAAEMYEKLKYLNKADEFFEKAVKIDPTDDDTVRKLKEWKQRYVKH